MITRYVNTASTAGGDGTTNNTTGADRAFASLQGAITSMALAEFADDLTIECCGSTRDTAVNFNTNLIVGTGYTIYIKANRSHINGFNNGVWNDAAYTVYDANNVFTFNLNKRIVLDGVQIYQHTNFYYNAILLSSVGANSIIKNCIIRFYMGSSGIYIPITSGVAFTLGNNILTGVQGFSSGAVFMASNSTDIKIYNNVITSATFGIRAADGQIIKNNIIFNCEIDINGTATIDYNATDDDVGTNRIVVSNWDDQFYNANYIADIDFRLKTGSVLIDAGVGPGVDASVLTTDIIGDTRSGSTASVGPFENKAYVCEQGLLHGSTGGGVWEQTCQPSKHYVKYSRNISDYQGATGIQGQTGIGIPGVTGIQGNTGAFGITGPQGITGLSPDGVTGIQGPIGVQGVTGIRGPNGILPGVTGITSFDFCSGDTSIQVGYRGQSRLSYDTVFEAWETVLMETGTFVTEVSVGSYADWPSSTVMNTGDTGPYVIDGIKNNGTTDNWEGITGAYGDYLQINVLESTVKQASVVLKHYEKR